MCEKGSKTFNKEVGYVEINSCTFLRIVYYVGPNMNTYYNEIQIINIFYNSKNNWNKEKYVLQFTNK